MKTLVSFVVLLTACATVHVDTSDVRLQMARQIAKVDSNSDQAERNYAEKSDIYKDLSPQASEAARDQMKDTFDRMTSGIENLRRIRRQLHESFDDFNTRTAKRPIIKSNESDFQLVQTDVDRFDEDMSFFNQAYAEYGRVSNDLNNVISQNQLNMTANADDIRAQLKKAVDHASKNLLVYDTQITNLKARAEANGTPLNSSIQHRLAGERDSYKEHLDSLLDVAKYLRLHTHIQKINSSSPEWPEFHQQTLKIEDVAREMRDIAKRLNADLSAASIKGSSDVH